MSALESVLGLLDQIGEAISAASKDLDEVRNRLREHPEIDTSATDATAKEFGGGDE